MSQSPRHRISELAQISGVPVATIKYYLREGLLPTAHRITPRLSEYDDRHVRRLALLRILREAGRVPVEGLRRLVEAASRPSTIHELFSAATEAMIPKAPTGGDLRPFTREIADQVIADAGWSHVRAEAVDRENLAAVLEQIATYDTHPRDLEELAPFVSVADQIARYEIGHLDDSKDRTGLLEEMVVGQAVFGEMLAILRRLAEEHHSFERFGEDRRD